MGLRCGVRTAAPCSLLAHPLTRVAAPPDSEAAADDALAEKCRPSATPTALDAEDRDRGRKGARPASRRRRKEEPARILFGTHARSGGVAHDVRELADEEAAVEAAEDGDERSRAAALCRARLLVFGGIRDVDAKLRAQDVAALEMVPGVDEAMQRASACASCRSHEALAFSPSEPLCRCH